MADASTNNTTHQSTCKTVAPQQAFQEARINIVPNILWVIGFTCKDVDELHTEGIEVDDNILELDFDKNIVGIRQRVLGDQIDAHFVDKPVGHSETLSRQLMESNF